MSLWLCIQWSAFLPGAAERSAAGSARFSLALPGCPEGRLQAAGDEISADAAWIREAKQPDNWTTFNTQSMLGEALLGQKKIADSEPLLLSGYQSMKQREKRVPPQYKLLLPEAIERLVQQYGATGKKDEADKWRKELNEAKKTAARAGSTK